MAERTMGRATTGGPVTVAALALLVLASTSGLALAQQPAGLPPAPVGAAPVGAVPASTEVPELVQLEIQAAEEALTRAIADFQGPQQSRSIVGFDDVIARLDAVRARYELPRRARDVLVEAYEYRGRAYYGIGLQEKASENFRLIVLVKPDHVLSKEEISPKIVELFSSVKKALVGYLAVSSQPAGARVTLIDVAGERMDLGLTDFFPLDVLAGEYSVEIAKEGYRTETLPLTVAARETETLDVPLTRILASVFVITQPDDVEVWIDGEHVLTTSGSLDPDHFVRARGGGLDPTRSSARIDIPNLTLGSHTVEFKRECFAPVLRTFNTDEPQDYDLEPVRLDESVASLNLRSDPPGARIYINGDARGVTPSQIDRICTGEVTVEVKHAAGKFITDLVLEKDEAISLDCPIRPTLAFLGVEAESTAGEQRREEAEARILENLRKLTTVNVINAPREAVNRVLQQEQTSRSALLAGVDGEPDAVRRVSERLAAALEVQGFVVAVLPEERLQRTAQLHLLAAGNTTAESTDVVYAQPASYIPVLERLDRQFTSQRTWSGLITVDTRLTQGVPVLRVVGGSPAAVAGLQPGDLVEAVDGQPIEKTADILAAVAAKKPKDSLSLHVSGPSGARAADLTLEETVREIPLFDPEILYNRAMVDLRGVVDGYPGTEQAAYAWLNLAICAMHFGDYAGAHESLQKAKAELPERPGLSRGTAFYYLGVVLERLNYLPQAREAYASAAAAQEATLIDNDGPAVAPLAERRARP